MLMTRRRLLYAATASGMTAFTSSCAQTETTKGRRDHKDILTWSAVDMANAVRRKRVSSEELTRLAIKRLESVWRKHALHASTRLNRSWTRSPPTAVGG
jgi:hypothetical protein